MHGIDCTKVLGANGVIFDGFEDRPDGFRIDCCHVMVDIHKATLKLISGIPHNILWCS